MHQQIRARLGRTSVDDGTGAMAAVPEEIDPLEVQRGALAELLQLLADNDFDLALAGGDAVELGGEFSFALKDHGRTGEAATLLRDNGYRGVRVLRVQELELEDVPGALAGAIRGLTDRGLKIDEIYVGVRRDDGVVPVQVTTIRDVEAATSA